MLYFNSSLFRMFIIYIKEMGFDELKCNVELVHVCILVLTCI